MTRVILHQFEFSHFNEKARWALGHKGVEHERISYLPGPHMPKINRLSGQRQTPVLQWNDQIIPGSAAIIEHLEEVIPAAPLYPPDPVERQAALDLQARFDAELGPATRTVLFSALINEGQYLTRMFSRGQPVLTRALYRLSFPLAKRLIAKGNGVTDPANVARAFETTDRMLDEVEQKVASTGYLIGAGFSVADLTAAALLAPLAQPDHPDMARPQPVPVSVTQLLARWRDHPAIAWVAEQYRQHRPPVRSWIQ